MESTVMDITYLGEEKHGFSTIQCSTENSPNNAQSVRPSSRLPAKANTKHR